MIRICFLFVAIISSLKMTGQTSVVEIQKHIDKTVWAPFQKAYEAKDADALNIIYADEVIRVTPNGIDTDGVFKRKNVESFKVSQENFIKLGLPHMVKRNTYMVNFI